MSSYELRLLPSGGSPLASVFFRGTAETALHLAQRTGQSSELHREGEALCSIDLDGDSGFWVITSLAPPAAAIAAY